MEKADQAFRADAAADALAAGVEAYRSWLRQLLAAGATPGAGTEAAQKLALSLAEQLNAWLRQSHPLVNGGPMAAQGAMRLQQLFGEWITAHARLASHWATVAQTAGAEFVAHSGHAPPALDLEGLRRHYDLWIECAERAYAITARSQPYCEDQAALIHATVALTAEARRQADSLAQAFDLPTRAELNALHQRVDALASRSSTAPARKSRAPRPVRKTRRGARKKPK